MPQAALQLEALAARGQRFGGPLRHLLLRGRAAGGEDRELVAADPVGLAVLPDCLPQLAPELGEDLVAGGVAEGVVVALETVEVEQHQGCRFLLGATTAGAEVDLHPALVAEPGQGVGPHLLQQALVLADADPEPGDDRDQGCRPERGGQPRRVIEVLHREEGDHHRREEGGDHQLAPAVETSHRLDRVRPLLPALGPETGRGEQVDRFDPVAGGEAGVGRLQGVGDIGDGEQGEPRQQQRPGLSRAPAGQGDDADDQRQHQDVADRIGERRRDLQRRPLGVIGDELEHQRGPEGGRAQRRDQPVHPQSPVELAGAGADQQHDPGRGQRVEGEVADVRRRGVGRRGVVEEDRGPVDLGCPPEEDRRGERQPGIALAAGPVGFEQAGESGGDHDRVVQRSIEKVGEAGAADPEPIADDDQGGAAEQHDPDHGAQDRVAGGSGCGGVCLHQGGIGTA